jgi:hypothetical protein
MSKKGERKRNRGEEDQTMLHIDTYEENNMKPQNTA